MLRPEAARPPAYLRETLPGRTCRSGSGAPAQTCHWPDCPRSPETQQQTAVTYRDVRLLTDVQKQAKRAASPQITTTHQLDGQNWAHWIRLLEEKGPQQLHYRLPFSSASTALRVWTLSPHTPVMAFFQTPCAVGTSGKGVSASPSFIMNPSHPEQGTVC